MQPRRNGHKLHYALAVLGQKGWLLFLCAPGPGLGLLRDLLS